LNTAPSESNEEIDDDPGDEDLEQIRELIRDRKNWRKSEHYPFSSYERFALKSFEKSDVQPILDFIHKKNFLSSPYSFTARVGILLKNRDTGKYFIFYPGASTSLFQNQVQRIDSHKKMNQLINSYDPQSTARRFQENYPDSKSVFVQPVYIEFTITKIKK
jgi:hypothetical protein